MSFVPPFDDRDSKEKKEKKPVKILGTEYDSWEAPICYAMGILFILLGGLLIYTAPQPVTGVLYMHAWQSQSWSDALNNSTMPGLIVTADPTVQATAVVDLTSIDGRRHPDGIVLEVFTGIALALLGMISLLIGEIAAMREQLRRYKPKKPKAAEKPEKNEDEP